MDKNMTLEKRIDAELYSYQGRMSVFVDDLQGHTVERGADEEFCVNLPGPSGKAKYSRETDSEPVP